MRRIITTFLWIIFGFSAAVSGQDLSGLSAAFVDVGIGARAVAFGGAYTALARNAGAAFWNPAGISYAEKINVEFSRVNQFGVIPYNAFSGTMGFAGDQAVGAALLHSGDDYLSETTVLLSWAMSGENFLSGEFAKWRAGINIKFHFADFGGGAPQWRNYPLFDQAAFESAAEAYVEGNAGGAGMDIGLLYDFSERLDLAFVYRNAFNKINWDNGQKSYDEGIPRGLVVGMAYQPARDLTFAFDFYETLTFDRSRRVHFGSEKLLLNRFALRGGIGQALAADGWREYALGFGLFHYFSGLGQAKFDYAFQLNDLQTTHRFSLGFQM